MKKRIAWFVMLAFLLTMLPQPSQAADTYNITVTYKIVTSTVTANEENYTDVVVEYTDAPGDTPLGTHGTVPSTDEGLIKARDFAGWITVTKSDFHKSGDNPLYSPTETLADVLGGQTTGEKTLYAYYDGLFERWVPFLGNLIPVANTNFNKHKLLFVNEEVIDPATAKENLMPNATIKFYSEETYENNAPALSFSPGDRGYTGTHKTITAYYDPTITSYQLTPNAVFNMNKGVAFVVKNNRVGQINQSEIYLDFLIPEDIDVPSSFENILFESPIFKLKEVNGREIGSDTYQALTVTNKTESAANPITTFSFDNTAGYRDFRFIVQPKNQGGTVTEVRNLTAKDYTKDMKLSFPETTFSISNAKAKTLADDTATQAVLSGNVSGKVVWQLFGLPMSDSITDTPSNNINIKFVYPTVIFDKNATDYGQAIDISDAVNITDGTIPADTFPKYDPFTFNNTTYHHTGWNTEADGTGMAVDATTLIKKDTILYAQWTPVTTVNVSFFNNTPRMEIRQAPTLSL